MVLSSGFVCYPIHSVHLLCFIASFQTLHPKLHCLACRLWHRSHGEAPGKGANVNQGEFTFGCTKMTLGCIGRPLNAHEHLWMHTHATLTFECLKTTLECTSKPSPKSAVASQGYELHSVMKQAWHMPLRPWILRACGHNKVWQSINNYTLSVKYKSMDKALANTLAVFDILERIAKGHRKAIPRFFCSACAPG